MIIRQSTLRLDIYIYIYLYIYNNIVQRNWLQIEHIPSIKQIADILTKQLLIDGYRKHCILIGLDIAL
jgi:DNA-binding transcriptional regulator YhcF (GntR family)